MGSVNKYCPHCGSQKIFEVVLHLEPAEDIVCDGILEFVSDETMWYECGDCHSEWEAHRHHATHMNYGEA